MSSLRISPLLRSKTASCSNPSRLSVRYANDLIITHRPDTKQSPKPIIKKGPPTGGRSASSGHTVTVFGCTGFLGRYVVSKIGKAGGQVIVPYRDEDSKRFLRVMGDLGQIVPLEWDARNPDQIYECVKNSDTVYNIVGRDWETRNYSYDDVNVKTAGLIAKICAEANVPRLIHVSHLNASPDSPSELYRSKYAGERAVRDAFKEATIVRPGPMFGAEDTLLHDIARWPAKYKLNGGETRIMPTYVHDVAEALAVMLSAPVTSTASTFSLPGPEIYTFNQLINMCEFFMMKKLPNYPTIPKPMAKLIATILNRAIWWPTVNPDEIERKYLDDVGVHARLAKAADDKPSGWAESGELAKQLGVDGEDVKSWADLGIEPSLIEEHAQKYLRMYRNSGEFDLPIEVGHFKPTKRYHVVP